MGEPRFRLVSFSDPEDGSIAVAGVIAPDAQLAAYKVAAARLRKERRERFGQTE